MDMRYQFFNEHLCYVCKNKESFSCSKLCSGCMLISYCGNEHQKIDRKNHKTICKAVKEITAQLRESWMDLYTAGMVPLVATHEPTRQMFLSSGTFPKSVWGQVRKNAQFLLEKQLKRRLTGLETQMVFLPKHCAVCFTRKNLKKELVCTDCFSVVYCSEEHRTSHNHKEVCSDLTKALDMDLFMLSVVWKSQKIHLIRPAQAISLKLDTCDMKNFIANYVQRGLKFEDETLFSFFYTNVLTFAYIVNRIPNFKLGKRLIIHLVGADNDEAAVTGYWENLLHFFPGVFNLTVVHIGPYIEGFPSKVRLCNDCYSANKSVDFLFHTQPYHEYCNSFYVVKPDVIVGFNGGLYDKEEHIGYDPWGPTLPFFFQYNNVPFISTDMSKLEAEADLQRLLSKDVIGNKKVDVVVNCEKNPYNNFRRWRNYDTPDDTPLYLKNSYVSVLIVK